MKERNIVKNILNRFVEKSKETLGNNLIGIYLHGSAAMGCFQESKSDLDLLLVVENSIQKEAKRKFMQELVKINAEAFAKGIELSIVKKEFCNPFVYPTPFELHFSIAHLKWFQEKPDEYVEKMNGTDRDLAAHFTIIRHCGVVLYGAAIQDIFGEVPREDYIDSIWNDIKNAEEDIVSEPMYMTLNLCRVLGYLKENRILSKKTGGEWGLCSVPEKYHALIQNALTCYESDKEMEIDTKTAKEYAAYMIREISLKSMGNLLPQ